MKYFTSSDVPMEALGYLETKASPSVPVHRTDLQLLLSCEILTVPRTLSVNEMALGPEGIREGALGESLDTAAHNQPRTRVGLRFLCLFTGVSDAACGRLTPGRPLTACWARRTQQGWAGAVPCSVRACGPEPGHESHVAVL